MYTKDGQEITVLHEIEGKGFLVAPIFDLDHGGYAEGPLMMIDAIYERAPTARFDAEVVRLRAEIKELRQQKIALRNGLREAERMAEERWTKLERLEALQSLEDFIDGKITHYVEGPRWARPRIVAFADTKWSDGQRKKKLLVLFGDSKGDLTWRMNQYYDGSGSWGDVIPCLSREEAIEKMTAILHEKMAESATRDLAKHVTEQGVPLPEGYMERVEEAEREDTEKEIAELRRKIEALEASMTEEG